MPQELTPPAPSALIAAQFHACKMPSPDITPPLTDRLKRVLIFLREFHSANGILPSTRDIQRHCAFRSQTSAVHCLRALEAQGFISRPPGKSRAYRLADPHSPPPQPDLIPLVNPCVPGFPDFSTALGAPQKPLIIDLASAQITPQSRPYAFRVRDDSMSLAQILTDDIVILEPRDPIHDDIVAITVKGIITLKRYTVRNHIPILISDCPSPPPFLNAADHTIHGVLISLIRKF